MKNYKLSQCLHALYRMPIVTVVKNRAGCLILDLFESNPTIQPPRIEKLTEASVCLAWSSPAGYGEITIQGYYPEELVYSWFFRHRILNESEESKTTELTLLEHNELVELFQDFGLIKKEEG
jgi:hypothetical protein